MEGGRRRRSTALFNAAVAVFALLGFGFTLHASYPGYLNPDSVYQIKQALGLIPYDDWHSPWVAFLMAAILKVIPNPFGYVVLVNVLIWGSFALLAIGLRPALGVGSGLLVTVPFLPGMYNFLGHVHVDALLAAWLTGSVAAAFLARSPRLSAACRTGFRILANVLVVAAFLTRINAVFGLIPLLLYANAARGTKKNLILCCALLIAMPLLYKAGNAAMEVKPAGAVDGMKTYNLLGISYYEGENLFPGEWNAFESQHIVESCYTPLQWDVAWLGACGFIYQGLKRQRLWGTPALTRAWLKAVTAHPVAYFRILDASFRQSMFDPNSRTMPFQEKNPWGWRVADDPPRPTTRWARAYTESRVNTQFGRPWVFVLLSIATVFLVIFSPLRGSRTGSLALAVTMSGLVYLLTYFPISVSSEYRYFYWSGFAAYTGALVAVPGLMRRNYPSSAVPAPPSPGIVAWLAACVAITAVAIVFIPFAPRTAERRILLTALDDKPVSVVGIHSSSLPVWKGPFEGTIVPGGWRCEGGGGTVSPLRVNPWKRGSICLTSA